MAQYAGFHIDQKPFPIRVKDGGRVEWALDQLIKAGPRGLVRSNPLAPRWAAYVHLLRLKGVTIHTTREYCDVLGGKIACYSLGCDVRKNWTL